jgi:predicted dinucleotide-binding enzyme
LDIGIIGAGNIGGTLTRRLRQLGHEVTVANSRGPQTLAELAQETGARAGTVEEAASAGPLVIVSVPLTAVPGLPADALAGRIVVDTDNYYPGRDGRIAAIDDGTPSSRWHAQQLPGARIVKAFNTIQARHLLELGRPAGDPDRIALPVASDDEEAKRTVMQLVDDLGFDPVDAGTLDESRRQEPGTPVYAADLTRERALEALRSAG